MGVPSRFAIEYPQRALELIQVFEGEAQRRDLVGSFGLLAAAAVLTIPYERMKSTHFLHNQERDSDLASQIKKLDKVAFLTAPFFDHVRPGDWQQSRITRSVEKVDDWMDDHGRPSLSDEANPIQGRKAEEVIRVLRNALAHGIVIYLDKERREMAGNRMAYMAFLSRYEETEEQRAHAETYRVVVTSESNFLSFVKAWATWIGRFPLNRAVAGAA